MTRLSQLRRVIWPERGFRRLFAYLMQRVVRAPGSSSSIAVSLSFGVAVSFTPFIGFHLILAAVLTSLARGNILVSAIGTFIGNPWTFPLIWRANYELGALILDFFRFDISQQSLSLGQFLSHLTDLLLGFDISQLSLSLDQLLSHLTDLLLTLIPITLGGFVLGTISWFTTYGAAYWAIDAWRRHRAKRLMEARLRRAQTTKGTHADKTHDTPMKFDKETDQETDQKTDQDT